MTFSNTVHIILAMQMNTPETKHLTYQKKTVFYVFQKIAFIVLCLMILIRYSYRQKHENT